MRVILIKKERLINFILPIDINGNFWISDTNNTNNDKRNLINIEAYDGKWILKSNFDVKIFYDNKEYQNIEAKMYGFYLLKLNDENIILYIAPTCDETYTSFKINNNSSYIIGKNTSSNIVFNFNLVNDNHAKLYYQNNLWFVEDLNTQSGTYVNNIRISKSKLSFGDVLFINGLKIIIMKDYIFINKIGNLITTNLESINTRLSEVDVLPYDETQNIKLLLEKNDYFHKSPRFKTSIEKEELIIEAPPAKENKDDMPLAYTVGPMITMGMTSLVSAFTAINSMVNNQKSFNTVLPTLIIAFAMLATMVLWPLLTKNYQKKQKIKKEQERQNKYSKYIEAKRQKLELMTKLQTQILKDNYITLEECNNIILNKKVSLWNRDIEQDDFLSLRVGIGNYPLQVNIKYNEEDFTMEEDNLKQEVELLSKEAKDLIDVPLGFSFTEKYVCGIVGNDNLVKSFLEGLLLQIMAFNCYDQLKIVFLTNERNNDKWEYLKSLPHLFSNDKSTRFYATNINEMKELSLYLERIFQDRKSISDKFDYKKYPPYYVIITDDYDTSRDLEIMKDILKQEENIGFSLIILDSRLAKLPNECSSFINIGDHTSGIFESEVVSTNQREFSAEFIGNIDISKCILTLANTKIELLNEDSNLPVVLGFLEMYNVGKVEQLNILNRWQNNTPITSLQAPIGVDRTGEILYLDLHEKSHGPHGLIAGMTGSGKSELIITFILSLATNYHPNDVSFVLIDYKGGGLAGAFENKETGLKLPHLAGTITNLDVADMNRSLVSIQSELRRRQALFNEARDSLNESTVDIYKYQKLYKEGKIKEPISHLFIISDEFAELKDQQPEFMDQLISTARIGRSLGVHLILATQKPSGVVNDQIWSNSKFRICLKVQEKNDSMEMIKCPDAASIKNVGRFFLQVGYNELFTMGQSAWCGIKYYPEEKIKKKVDTKLDFIDNIGNVIKSADNAKVKMESHGEEITNIINYIVKTAKEYNISNKKLWLDKIPEVIYTSDLIQKYDFKSEPYLINSIVGEYDDPFNQKQGLLTLNLTKNGNVVIYGIAGSGKEMLLNNLIYSTLIYHSVDEVNLYLLDFGTESLKIFNDAPQVGEYLSVNDNEKIEKLFKMLNDEIEIRKEKLSNYAGDYSVFIKNSTEKLPLILVVMNNYDNFIENNENYFEPFISLTREGVKYGITTIVTASNTSTLRYKLRQNFSQELTLQLTDEMDYTTILGRFDKIIIDTCKGRGLVKLDNVYEYQVAYPYKEDELTEKVKELCQNLKTKFQGKARRIPILPSIVSVDYIKNSIDTMNNIPVGVSKETLQIVPYNYGNKELSLICAQDIYIATNFLNGLFDVFSKVSNISVVVLDFEQILNIKNSKINYYNEDFENVINKLDDLFEQKKINNDLVCAILGVEGLLSKISVTVKEKLIKLFNASKDMKNLKFILIDSTSRLKKLEYEPWYKNSVNNTNGIFIGSGIANQYTLTINKVTREHRDDLPDNFGYIVSNGKTILIKLLEGDNNE